MPVGRKATRGPSLFHPGVRQKGGETPPLSGARVRITGVLGGARPGRRNRSDLSPPPGRRRGGVPPPFRQWSSPPRHARGSPCDPRASFDSPGVLHKGGETPPLPNGTARSQDLRHPPPRVAPNVFPRRLQLRRVADDSVMIPTLPDRLTRRPPVSIDRLGRLVLEPGDHLAQERSFRSRRVVAITAREMQNTVQVVRHDDPRIQVNARESRWDTSPPRFHTAPELGSPQTQAKHFAEDAMAPRSTDRDQIRGCSCVVMALHPGRFPMPIRPPHGAVQVMRSAAQFGRLDRMCTTIPTPVGAAFRRPFHGADVPPARPTGRIATRGRISAVRSAVRAARRRPYASCASESPAPVRPLGPGAEPRPVGWS